MESSMLIFVVGGARSGKSSFAEQLLTQTYQNGHLHYIATSVRIDQEMNERILQHRQNRGDKWNTWEQPTNIASLKKHFSADDEILLDCLTILTANELFKGGLEQNAKQVFEKLVQEIQELSFVKRLVIVSNDIFSNGVPDDVGTYHYMKLLGALHQELANKASRTYRVTNGIAELKKLN